MPRLRATTRSWLLLCSAAVVGAVACTLLVSPATTSPSVATPQVDTANPVPPLPVVYSTHLQPKNSPNASTVGDQHAPPDRRDPETRNKLFDAARRHCPWPPHPATWHTLDGACEAALNPYYLTDDWRAVLANPLGARRALSLAFDNPECRPFEIDPQSASWRDWPRWRGKARPELAEPCAADSMGRVAELQRKCIERLHKDWNEIYNRSVGDIDQIAAEHSFSQEKYYRFVEDEYHRRIGSYWKNHMCRSVPAAALEWLDAFPEPPGDPTAHRYKRPPITQAIHLYDAARRLGAEVPKWALPPPDNP